MGFRIRRTSRQPHYSTDRQCTAPTTMHIAAPHPPNLHCTASYYSTALRRHGTHCNARLLLHCTVLTTLHQHSSTARHYMQHHYSTEFHGTASTTLNSNCSHCTSLHCTHYTAAKTTLHFHCISLHCNPITLLYFTVWNSLHCTPTIAQHCTHYTAPLYSTALYSQGFTTTTPCTAHH